MTVIARLEYDACAGSWCLLDGIDINVLWRCTVDFPVLVLAFAFTLGSCSTFR